jgi:hypothetical protein
VTVAFAAGIALAGIQALPVASLLFPCLTAAALLLAARLYSPRLLPAVACTLALLLGALRQAGDEARHPNVLAPWLGERVTVTGQVEGDPQPRPTGWRCRLQVRTLVAHGRTQALDAGLLLLGLWLMTQLTPARLFDFRGQLRSLVYSALED